MVRAKPGKPVDSPPPPPRRRRPHRLGLAVGGVARPILGRKGFAEADILTRWDAIAGPELAVRTLPLRVVKSRNGGGGVLHVRVASAAFATLIAHEEPRIVERINTHFGFEAVARLRLSVGSLPAPVEAAPAPPPPPLDPGEADLVAGVEDPDLRDSLERLGRSVRGRSHGTSGG